MEGQGSLYSKATQTGRKDSQLDWHDIAGAKFLEVSGAEDLAVPNVVATAIHTSDASA